MVLIALASSIVAVAIGLFVATRAALRLHRRWPRVVELARAAESVASRAAAAEAASTRVQAATHRVRTFGEALR